MTFERIDQARAQTLISEEAGIVVDIRDPASFGNGHITNAIHLTNESLGVFLEQIPKDKPIIVCCYHGNSSQGAADFLNQQGFDRSYSLDGGFTAWQAAGLAFETT